MERQSQRVQLCVMLGAGGTFVVETFRLHEERDLAQKLNEEIVAKAKKTTVMTLAQHIALVKIALRHRSNKDELLKAHLEELAVIEKSGIKLQFGARFDAYLNGYPDLWDLAHLAKKNEPVFTDDEIKEGKKNLKSPVEHAMKRLGQLFAETGIAGVAGALACGRVGGKLVSVARSPFRSRPVESRPTIESQPVEAQPEPIPPPELKEVRDVVNETLNPDFESRRRSPREVLWVGANTTQGNHTDMFLIVDNTVNPPHIKITGVAYKIPVAEESKPEPPKVIRRPAVAAVEAPIGLSQLRAKLIAEHFPKHFGSRIQPVEDVFSLAEKLKLTPEEFRRFQDETARVKTLNDVKHLERLLLDIQESRRIK